MAAKIQPWKHVMVLVVFSGKIIPPAGSPWEVPIISGENGDLMVNLWGLMGFNGDLMGFNGDLMDYSIYICTNNSIVINQSLSSLSLTYAPPCLAR